MSRRPYRPIAITGTSYSVDSRRGGQNVSDPVCARQAGRTVIHFLSESISTGAPKILSGRPFLGAPAGLPNFLGPAPHTGDPKKATPNKCDFSRTFFFGCQLKLHSFLVVN
jgi:hypothetical protein